MSGGPEPKQPTDPTQAPDATPAAGEPSAVASAAPSTPAAPAGSEAVNATEAERETTAFIEKLVANPGFEELARKYLRQQVTEAQLALEKAKADKLDPAQGPKPLIRATRNLKLLENTTRALYEAIEAAKVKTQTAASSAAVDATTGAVQTAAAASAASSAPRRQVRKSLSPEDVASAEENFSQNIESSPVSRVMSQPLDSASPIKQASQAELLISANRALALERESILKAAQTTLEARLKSSESVSQDTTVTTPAAADKAAAAAAEGVVSGEALQSATKVKRKKPNLRVRVDETPSPSEATAATVTPAAADKAAAAQPAGAPTAAVDAAAPKDELSVAREAAATALAEAKVLAVVAQEKKIEANALYSYNYLNSGLTEDQKKQFDNNPEYIAMVNARETLRSIDIEPAEKEAQAKQEFIDVFTKRAKNGEIPLNDVVKITGSLNLSQEQKDELGAAKKAAVDTAKDAHEKNLKAFALGTYSQALDPLYQGTKELLDSPEFKAMKAAEAAAKTNGQNEADQKEAGKNAFIQEINEAVKQGRYKLPDPLQSTDSPAAEQGQGRVEAGQPREQASQTITPPNLSEESVDEIPFGRAPGRLRNNEDDEKSQASSSSPSSSIDYMAIAMMAIGIALMMFGGPLGVLAGAALMGAGAYIAVKSADSSRGSERSGSRNQLSSESQDPSQGRGHVREVQQQVYEFRREEQKLSKEAKELRDLTIKFTKGSPKERKEWQPKIDKLTAKVKDQLGLDGDVKITFDPVPEASTAAPEQKGQSWLGSWFTKPKPLTSTPPAAAASAAAMPTATTQAATAAPQPKQLTSSPEPKKGFFSKIFGSNTNGVKDDTFVMSNPMHSLSKAAAGSVPAPLQPTPPKTPRNKVQTALGTPRGGVPPQNPPRPSASPQGPGQPSQKLVRRNSI